MLSGTAPKRPSPAPKPFELTERCDPDCRPHATARPPGRAPAARRPTARWRRHARPECVRPPLRKPRARDVGRQPEGGTRWRPPPCGRHCPARTTRAGSAQRHAGRFIEWDGRMHRAGLRSGARALNDPGASGERERRVSLTRINSCATAGCRPADSASTLHRPPHILPAGRTRSAGPGSRPQPARRPAGRGRRRASRGARGRPVCSGRNRIWTQGSLAGCSGHPRFQDIRSRPRCADSTKPRPCATRSGTRWRATRRCRRHWSTPCALRPPWVTSPAITCRWCASCNACGSVVSCAIRQTCFRSTGTASSCGASVADASARPAACRAATPASGPGTTPAPWRTGWPLCFPPPRSCMRSGRTTPPKTRR